MNSETFYKLLKASSNFLLTVLEKLLKAYLNTTLGQGSLKWFINFIVKRLRKEVAEPIMAVSLIKINYYYDTKDADNKVKRLIKAHESENEDLYYTTLNDILK